MIYYISIVSLLFIYYNIDYNIISREHALSATIVDRIFQVGTRVFADGGVGGFDEQGWYM